MGTVYKLQCKHCGTQFIHSGESNYGIFPTCVGCGDDGDRRDVVRCPGCQRRINGSLEEFRDQILEESSWE